MRNVVCAALTAMVCATTAAGDTMTPTPVELKVVFESYTKKMGIDPNTCRFGIWDSGVFLSTRKATFANHFATCPMKAPYKVCTQLAPKLNGKMAVENGCVVGLNRVSFLPIAAVSTKGGHFVIIHETDGKPLRLAQQLSLGFGEKFDFCEMSAQLIDQDANQIVAEQFHSFPEMLINPSACLAP